MLSTKEVGSILSSAKDQPDGGPHHTNTFGRTSSKLAGRGQSLRGVNGDNDEDFVNEQHQLAKLIHLVYTDDNDQMFRLLNIVRRELSEGGIRVQYTFPSIVSSCLKLARSYLPKPESDQPAIHEQKNIITQRPVEHHRDAKRVMDTLNRALKVAHSVIDPVKSIELLVEILNRYFYFFEHQWPSIEPSHINGLIDLIKNNYTSLSESQPQSLDGTNSTDHLGSLLKFFQGSLDYVQTKSNSNTDSSIAYGQLKLDSSITPSSIVQNDNIDEVAEIDKPIEKEEDVELATSNEDQNEHIPTRSVDQIVNGIPSSDTIDSELSDPKELFATFLATIRLLVKWR